jgi:hypothetical protein
MEYQTQEKKKSFWDMPEGILGQIIGVAILGGIGYSVFKALPYIITLCQNAIIATVLGVVTIALLTVVTDKRFWKLGEYFYASIMRKLWYALSGNDPIGVKRKRAEDLEKRQKSLDAGISDLAGKIRLCKNTITDNEKKRDNIRSRLIVARREGDMMAVNFEASQLGMLDDDDKSYKDMLQQLEFLYRVITKFQKAAGFMIKSLHNEIELKERRDKAAKGLNSIMASAKAILNGDSMSNELNAMADEALDRNWANAVGQIEDFSRYSEDFMRSFDLQSKVNSEKGMSALLAWEKNVDNLFITNNTAPVAAKVDNNWM